MAEIKPLRALHYDPAVAGPLQDLVAPPYDVIDADYRRRLAQRNSANVVGIDLPEGEDPYAHAAELLSDWKQRGIVVRDEQPAIWATTQAYAAPDGTNQLRRGFYCRVRVSDYGPGLVRPHERTHPAAKEDRLRLMRATKANLSPIFSLYSDSGEAWSALEPQTAADPWGEITDDEQTVNRLWRVTDPAAIDAVAAVLDGKELLIADGHHRYETARTYAAEIGGEGDHNYVLMCLVSMSDPGLTVFPTHRLVGKVDEHRRRALEELLEREFKLTEVAPDELAPPAGNGLPTFGFFDKSTGRALRLELNSAEAVDRALPDRPSSYRQLDTAVLEKLVLEDALGLSEEDISHHNGFGYARNLDKAMSALRDGDFELAFMMRPTPIDQVRAVAEDGETMPPKSTYFFPKLPSGLLFNLLS
jgi:uncharacterized protein (DUF1015 family)